MLNELRLDETPDSFEVILDKDRGRFEFYGKSMPEDPNSFFIPILDWLKEYVKTPNRETIVTFKIDYFNSASSKKLLDIFTILSEIHKKKMSIVVNWYYRPIDEDMFESGETFAELSKIPFKFLPY
ncbi:MAG TPA: DUF1987 domain-containing protein [Tenuifilaceae bacterium]|jgi:hypothetical protein|nr:DUF1987 domain-containing protein [Tenuifilaceae bacterium]HPX04972.1 DUF1987 domain-containing protein [Tenuifilaceae bacterium]HQB78532.1 DUF1987 domain-containing protein [Tenuifilaceae bacterium]